MNEFKEQMNKAFRALVMMEEEWNNLGREENNTVMQIVQETGFDELGNFEEVVYRFEQFYLQMHKVTVIEGYLVYIDDYDRLHIIKGEVNYIAVDLIDIIDGVNLPEVMIPKDIMLKILEWYIEEV